MKSPSVFVSLCVSRLSGGYFFFSICQHPSLSIPPLSRDVMTSGLSASGTIFNSLPHKGISNVLFISSFFLFSHKEKTRRKNQGGKEEE
jgi:hypothetical protein